MKSELVINAEKEARESCEGLGLTEAQIQAHIDMHVEGELRRDEAKAKELASAKRNKALSVALIHVAVSPWRDFYDTPNPPETFDNEPPVISRGHDAEDEESARLDSRDRARECNRG